MSATRDYSRVIETRYAGRHFRSRLEARWGVFFTALDLAFDYEPEGYVLPVHGPYLCDFFLPAQALWVEIKPTEPTEKERQRCVGLSIVTCQDVLLITGSPYRHCIARWDLGRGEWSATWSSENTGTLFLRFQLLEPGRVRSAQDLDAAVQLATEERFSRWTG